MGDKYQVFARSSSPDPKLITLENYCQPETPATKQKKKGKYHPFPPTSPIDEISKQGTAKQSQSLRIQVSARSQEVWIETENGEIGERETRKLRLTDLRIKWTVLQSRSAIERTFHRPWTVSVRDPTVRTPISDHPG